MIRATEENKKNIFIRLFFFIVHTSCDVWDVQPTNFFNIYPGVQFKFLSLLVKIQFSCSSNQDKKVFLMSLVHIGRIILRC